MKTVGIPRCLFYYYYYPLWKTFFVSLGARVVTSGVTNHRIVDQGIMTAVDEACLPVKVYYGHVKELCRQGVDYIFAPRLVSVEHRSYICPKFMGIPDMLRAQIPDLAPLIDIKIDFSRNSKQVKSDMRNIGKLFGQKPAAVDQAYQAGLEALKSFYRLTRTGYTPAEALKIWEENNERGPGDGKNGERPDSGFTSQKPLLGNRRGPTRESGRGPGLNVGLLGHGYSVYDEVISLSLIRRLEEMGARVVTPEMLPAAEVESHAATLPKRMFWTLGKKMIGSALRMDEDPGVDGIIYLACFGCGPDSLVGQIIESRLTKTPFMLVTVDEHTGEAGLATRVEAFCDMICRRKKVHESNFSAYG